MQVTSRRRTTPFACVVAVVLLLSAPVIATDATPSQQQLDALRTRIDDVRSAMAAKAGEKSALERKLQQTEERVGQAAQQLRDTDNRLTDQRDRLDALRAGQARLEESLQTQRDALARQVRAAYAMGRQERLKLLLNQQQPEVVSRMMAYYDYLGRARAARMAAIRVDIDRLRDTTEAILREESELARLRARQQDELAELQASQGARRDVLARLNREIADQGQALERLQADARELTALLEGLEKALAEIPVPTTEQVRFDQRRGRLPWPAGGAISHAFGSPRLGSLVWDGVIIAAQEGNEVRAVHHGRVAYADWLRGFGLMIIVDHGDGYMTLYGHNQSLFKELGDWVDEDEPIALVGNSGGREQSGVYFGIRYQGRAVNPARWCRRATNGRVG
ncbi:MAG: peptidoglycan DD-metalloendopeptidase family protein [Gammaproteobacteria bacterium]|nr:peptidoglycan DD-metalloendopeptidase family protein [Gammaproteobacteria bacterium]